MLPDAVKESRNLSGSGISGCGGGLSLLLRVEAAAGVLVVLVEEEVGQEGGAGNAGILRTELI